MPVACILIPHFPIKAEIQRCPALRGKPVLIAETLTGEDVVVDFAPHVRGIERGMPLAQAVSMTPDAQVMEADTDFYKKSFQDILSTLLRYSPLVEGPELGLANVGLDGLELLYGDNARLVTALGNAIPSALGARIGVGENKFIAFLAATKARLGSAFRAPEDAAEFVGAFSVDMLPVDKAIREKVHTFNLHTLSDVAGVGIGPLQAQFGPVGKLMWELANGVDNRVLVPMRQEDYVQESMSFPYEVATLDVLLRAVEMLLRRAFGAEGIRGRSVAGVMVECAATGMRTWARTFHVQGGVADAARAMALMKVRLEAEHPPYPFERLTVTLSVLTGEQRVQPGLVRGVREADQDFAGVDQRIRPRAEGKPGLYRVMAVHPSHPAPEMRAVQVPVDRDASGHVKALQTPVPVRVLEEEALPTAVFTGGRMAPVLCVEDTWKINLWWMLQPLKRQYFTLACAGDRRITVFRDETSGDWFQQSY